MNHSIIRQYIVLLTLRTCAFYEKSRRILTALSLIIFGAIVLACVRRNLSKCYTDAELNTHRLHRSRGHTVDVSHITKYRLEWRSDLWLPQQLVPQQVVLEAYCLSACCVADKYPRPTSIIQCKT